MKSKRPARKRSHVRFIVPPTAPWYHADTARAIRGDRAKMLRSVLRHCKGAKTSCDGPSWLSYHRDACAIVKSNDSNVECDCVALILYTGAVA